MLVLGLVLADGLCLSTEIR